VEVDGGYVAATSTSFSGASLEVAACRHAHTVRAHMQGSHAIVFARAFCEASLFCERVRLDSTWKRPLLSSARKRAAVLLAGLLPGIVLGIAASPVASPYTQRVVALLRSLYWPATSRAPRLVTLQELAARDGSQGDPLWLAVCGQVSAVLLLGTHRCLDVHLQLLHSSSGVRCHKRTQTLRPRWWL
jgi:hypothetical protein